MRKTWIALIMLGLFISAEADYKDLDQTFGENGVATALIIPPYESYLRTLSLQTHQNGKIITSGTYYDQYTSSESIYIARQESNGSIDTTFGTPNGVILTPPFADYPYLTLQDMMVQSDEKIVLMMTSENQDYNVSSISLLRYNIDGSPDDTFGVKGRAAVDFISVYSMARMVQQPDGKFLATGFIQENTPAYSFVAVRFNNDGSLDTSFGTDGVSKFLIPNLQNTNGVTLLSDGSSLTMIDVYDPDTGLFSSQLIKITSTGELDLAFGSGNGLADVTFPNQAYPINFVTDTAGRAIVLGALPDPVDIYSATTCLSRYNIDGSLDMTYGTNGLVEHDIQPNDMYFHQSTMFIGKDDKVTLVFPDFIENTMAYPNVALGIYRISTDGSLDMTFGTNGSIYFPEATFGMTPSAATIQDDGKILVVGDMDDSGLITTIRLNASSTKPLPPAIINYLLD